MRSLCTILLLLPVSIQAADIQSQATIACVSDESSLQGRHRQSDSQKNSEQAKSRFSEWMMAENFSAGKSRINFAWQPHGVKGEVITYDCHFDSRNPAMGEAGKALG